ncbi:hypothetical protein B0H16DRAFT_1470543 [Mycena metata]|uniref:Uncharacterized protein n=1 Tax=Mycena metata TaxID=1033252 RepID=A0AAD7MQF9_9AGAR|nr:hypothetical protein B0H16DRAFT_1470543 [Mycena metata]
MTPKSEQRESNCKACHQRRVKLRVDFALARGNPLPVNILLQSPPKQAGGSTGGLHACFAVNTHVQRARMHYNLMCANIRTKLLRVVASARPAVIWILVLRSTCITHGPGQLKPIPIIHPWSSLHQIQLDHRTESITAASVTCCANIPSFPGVYQAELPQANPFRRLFHGIWSRFHHRKKAGDSTRRGFRRLKAAVGALWFVDALRIGFYTYTIWYYVVEAFYTTWIPQITNWFTLFLSYLSVPV